MKKMFWIVTLLFVLCVAASYGQYKRRVLGCERWDDNL